MTTQGKSVQNQLWGIRAIVIAMMRREGRDFTICELCGRPITSKFNLHHTRYEGATYYDLMIVCPSCNNQPENCLLE